MPTTTAPPMIDHRYIVRDTIGEGSFGVVYRVEDRLTGDTVALKHATTPTTHLIFSSRGADSQVNLALAQEFRTLASLRHPNIISVLDYGFDHNHQPYFTMELLENPQTILAAGKSQPVETQVGLLVELLQALTYLHRRGLLHRDLKPPNVLVTEQGRAMYSILAYPPPLSAPKAPRARCYIWLLRLSKVQQSIGLQISLRWGLWRSNC